MLIVADQHIPFIQDIFSDVGDLRLVPGQMISPEIVRDAHILIVRSITQVNRALLGKSAVRYVGSATAGVDHVDQEFLHHAGIRFGHAPGANAESVVEYVLACLAEFSHRRNESFLNRTIGIIGVGHVGSLLARRCKALGMKTLLNDPPRKAMTANPDLVSLEQVIQGANILTVHTPLTHEGAFQTEGLLHAGLLKSVRPDTWLVHSARGGVCVETDLLEARRSGPISALALDVWESEPTPNTQHIAEADISTGHIAGYSLDAKINGLSMLRNDILGTESPPAMAPHSPAIKSVLVTEQSSLESFVQQLYPVAEDDYRFRGVMMGSTDQAAAFHAYRATYPVRRAFREMPIEGSVPEKWREGLGLT